MPKINLLEAFELVPEPWRPRIAAELNDSYVKLVRLAGEFVWHHHEHEDELFLVVSGVLRMQFRDREETLNPGELIVVPRGVEHRPVADSEALVLLLEPKTTLNTGNVQSERTIDAQWIYPPPA